MNKSSEISASVTLANSPEKWSGPGIYFAVSDSDSQSSVAKTYVQSGGPRLEIAQWEKRWISGQHTNSSKDGLQSVGSQSLAERFKESGSDNFSFELDLSWNSAEERQLAYEYMNRRLPEKVWRFINSLPPLDEATINENRTPQIEPDFDDLSAQILDIPINSLPSSRRRSRTLQFATRWVRLIILKTGIISLWHEVGSDRWDPEQVHWPHNAVPSYKKAHLDEDFAYHHSVDTRLSRWIDEIMVHELYFLTSWQSEIEFWQGAAFRWLSQDLSSKDVEVLRDDLGHLSTYLNSVRWTQRALSRRSQESGFLVTHPDVSTQIEESQERISKLLVESRRSLTESFTILSTVSQRVQEEAANDAKASSQRLNWLITLFTTILFVPTIVTGIYGANLSLLSEGAKGSLEDLLVLMGGCALFSFGILNVVPRRWSMVTLGIIGGAASILAHLFPISWVPTVANTSQSLWVFAACVIFITIYSLMGAKNDKR